MLAKQSLARFWLFARRNRLVEVNQIQTRRAPKIRLAIFIPKKSQTKVIVVGVPMSNVLVIQYVKYFVFLLFQFITEHGHLFFPSAQAQIENTTINID